MHDSYVALADLVDEAIASSVGVVPEPVIAEASDRARLIRRRLSHPADIAVVAIAGGTGSGKSSLFNALVGADVVESSGIRPTTTRPTAAVPESAGQTVDTWLAELGVTDLVRYQGGKLVWVDLPDSDSTDLSNREVVEDLVPVVDFIVWVADPEKYRDRVLHHDFLAPLRGYRDHVVFALNQVDRLNEDEVEVLLSDFRSALELAGYEEPHALAVAADPVSGPPFGVAELAELAAELAPGESRVFHRVRLDAEILVAQLSEALGTSLDFDSRANKAVEEAAHSLIEGAGAGALVAFLEDIAEGTSNVRIREELLLLAADVPARSRYAIEPQAARWWQRKRNASAVAVAGRLNELFIRPARALLVGRARGQAAVTALALRLDELTREPLT